MTVQVGVMTSEVTDMKITERIEKDSGKVVVPGKYTGKLKLQNSSTDQTVRLIGGKIHPPSFMVEEKKFEPAIKFQTYGAAERLDPGQDATQGLDVDVPAVALKAKKLKEIRLELVSYLRRRTRRTRSTSRCPSAASDGSRAAATRVGGRRASLARFSGRYRSGAFSRRYVRWRTERGRLPN